MLQLVGDTCFADPSCAVLHPVQCPSTQISSTLAFAMGSVHHGSGKVGTRCLNVLRCFGQRDVRNHSCIVRSGSTRGAKVQFWQCHFWAHMFVKGMKQVSILRMSYIPNLNRLSVGTVYVPKVGIVYILGSLVLQQPSNVAG